MIEKAEEALRQAQALARGSGHPQADVEHVALALFTQDGKIAGLSLRRPELCATNTGSRVPRLGLHPKLEGAVMSPGDLIWLFFLFSALQPVLKQRFLEASRQRLIAKIERQRGSRVILLVHRQETMSLLGFPVFRYIDVNDSEEVLRAIHLTDPAVPIDIVLHTPGGLV